MNKHQYLMQWALLQKGVLPSPLRKRKHGVHFSFTPFPPSPLLPFGDENPARSLPTQLLDFRPRISPAAL
jgi:hypothetical protein